MLRRSTPRALPLALASVAAIALARIPFLLFPFDTQYSLLVDDAYYYLEAARRWIGSGHWPTLDGRNPTNGFHPLYMGLMGGLQALLGTDARVVIPAVLAFNLLCNGVTAWLLLRAWQADDERPPIAPVVLLAALAPGLVAHALSGVENSLSSLLLLLFALRMKRRLGSADAPPGATLAPGLVIDAALGGLAMLGRTDAAVYVVTGACVLAVVRRRAAGARRALSEAFVFALIAFAIVQPWLIVSAVHFGTLVQDSALAIRARLHALDGGIGSAGWLKRGLLDTAFWIYRLAWAWGLIPLTGALLGRALPVDGLRRAASDRAAAILLPVLCAAAIVGTRNDLWFIESPKGAALELALGAAGFACGLAFLRAPSRRPAAPVLWAAGSTLLLAALYAFGFGHFQVWYTTGPTVVGLLLWTGSSLTDLARARPRLVAVLALLTVVQAAVRTTGYAARGGYDGRMHDVLAQGESLRAGLERLSGPAGLRVGSFDSGRLSYLVHPFPITNLDGVMNHAAAHALAMHALGDYLERDRIAILIAPAARIAEFQAVGPFAAAPDTAATRALGWPVFRREAGAPASPE